MRILILAGGASAEREVSLESGAAVSAALRDRGHAVTLMDPAAECVKTLSASNWDIAIPLVHGTGGEDGTLQTDLRTAGLPWIGSSVEASALTFDKIRTGRMLAQHGIRIPRHVVVSRNESIEEIRQRLESLKSTIVTKPPCQGSSVGISIVRDRRLLPKALDLAFEFGTECLIEEFIEGREVTVAVMDGRPLSTIEIRPVAWYDYEAKYSDDRTEYTFPDAPWADQSRNIAVEACNVCGVTGIARVDLRVDENDVPWILEVNTIPGMTSHSLVPMAARREGLSLAELFESAIATKLGSSV